MTHPVRPIKGHVDAYSGDRVTGWAFDPGRPDERVCIEVVQNGERLCTGIADLFREDVRKAGHGDGRHGFCITLPVGILAEPLVKLHVRVATSGLDLTGSPITVHNDHPHLDGAVLRALGQTILATAGAAESAEGLAELETWLLQHFDIIHQQRTALAEAARGRIQSFKDLIGDRVSLSELLQNAVAMVTTQYARIDLPVSDDPLVTIIIPAFNHFDFTHRCLHSIMMEQPKTSFEVIVVDDWSTDETVYAALVLGSGIRLVRNPHNVGFLHSVEKAARLARGSILFLLNNDCVVRQGWLDHLVETLAGDVSIGIAGSKLLFPDGRLQEAGGIIWQQGTGHNYGRFKDPLDPRYCFMRDVDYVSGAALMIRREVFESVGGLSDAFAPGYYEDTDLCFKVRAAGHRVVVQPLSQITHFEGVSSGTDVAGTGMKRFQHSNRRTFFLKWNEQLKTHSRDNDQADLDLESERHVGRRLLFIDVTVPTPDRDAGSAVAFDHMLTLQKLGFKVCFVGADNMANIPPYTDALEGAGIESFYAPYYRSLEEVISRAKKPFDFVYIHRLVNMLRYVGMIRQYLPNAFIVYNMADIHYLRLEREAAFHGNARLAKTAAHLKRNELEMVAAADSVIVHSSFEAGLLETLVPDATTHVIPWTQPIRRVAATFQERSGVAFIGGYNHPPNVDAADWLVTEIMPLVWAEDPDITCLLIGSDMPPAVQALAGPLVKVIGHVPDLFPVLNQVRLTIAPLRYGAGIKGKVLTSLASGLPCAATPCAVEGMDLPAGFDCVVAEDAVTLAHAILRLHRNSEFNETLATAGIDFIAARFSRARVEAGLQAATRRKITDPKIVREASITRLGKGGRRRLAAAAEV